MIAILKAVFYALFRVSLVRLTVVRRYVDAQQHFIGELYLGEGREAQMVGMSCDNLPFSVGAESKLVQCHLDWRKDFLSPLPPNTIRVGGLEPSDNQKVREQIALRRFCVIRISVLNRFIEHVLEANHV